MNLSLIVKLLHVLSAFWFISGVVGRNFVYWRAGKADNVHAAHSLLQVSEFFERWAVIAGAFLVAFFGLVAVWVQGWPIFGFLQGAASNWLLVSVILYVGMSLLVPFFRLIPRRKQRTKALEDALAQGVITPELAAALNDKVVRGYRLTEVVMIVVVIVLMVTKPF